MIKKLNLTIKKLNLTIIKIKLIIFSNNQKNKRNKQRLMKINNFGHLQNRSINRKKIIKKIKFNIKIK